MKLKFALGMVAVASLIAGCKGANTQSTEEGVAVSPEGGRAVRDRYSDIEYYLQNDSQLQSIARSNNPIQLWFVPKDFGGVDGELHVCVYANNEQRPTNRYDESDTSNFDLDRFSRAVVLKGGKYINWSTLFQVLNDEKNSGRWNPNIAETFTTASAMLKDEKVKLRQSLQTNLEDMTVVKPRIVSNFEYVSGLWVKVDRYANEDEKYKAESVLAGILLTLARTPTTSNPCPTAANLAQRARGQNPDVVVKPAEPIQINVPRCTGDQALVNHNRKNGWICEGRGAYSQYGKNCKDSGNGYFRERPDGDISDRNTWKCMNP